MGIVQSEPAILLSNRVNGLTSVVLGIFFSSMAWRSTIVNLQQKRRIDKQQKELEDKNRSLQYLASTDPLTGLINRRIFDEKISFEISRIKRYGSKSSLLIVDIDNFKDVNDNFGHPVGDALLVEFALMLKELLRETDIVARIGGEEFAILLTGTDGENGRIVAEKIRETTENKIFVIDGNEINITVSIGLAALDSTTDSYAEVYKYADKALYISKAKGKNRVDDSIGQMRTLPI
jgi:diguanylate cyclase (GGDEF)-like protein